MQCTKIAFDILPDTSAVPRIRNNNGARGPPLGLGAISKVNGVGHCRRPSASKPQEKEKFALSFVEVASSMLRRTAAKAHEHLLARAAIGNCLTRKRKSRLTNMSAPPPPPPVYG